MNVEVEVYGPMPVPLDVADDRVVPDEVRLMLYLNWSAAKVRPMT
jgi:hypothetical protein